MTDAERMRVVEAALARLDLDTKARLLAGHDEWALPDLPRIGLRSLVFSDGPIGVRGVRWTPEDPSIALPSGTALGASWDPELARRVGRLLAQEARRKGVHVVLGPTINLHRSPLGGRHFEALSEDPYLTGVLAAAYVAGVQDGGVATTAKHFVANEAETARYSVNNIVGSRALRELYLAPFETVVEKAHPWGIMSAYNAVNGPTMTEHHHLQNEVLRGEWGFDGCVVSDWMAARDTVGAITGGMDVAMPGPQTVYGEPLARAVRAGRVKESLVDDAVRRVLLLAARVGLLEGAPPAVPAPPAPIDGRALAREAAHGGFVLLRNENAALPLDAPALRDIALIGSAARDARVMGGGAAQVFPERVVSPLDGLRGALPDSVRLTYCPGTRLTDELDLAAEGFTLRAIVRDAEGHVIGESALPTAEVQWSGTDMPEGVSYETLHSVETVGTFTPRKSGPHTFGFKGLGHQRLVVDGHALYDGEPDAPETDDPLSAYFTSPIPCGTVDLTAGKPVEVSLLHIAPKPDEAHNQAVVYSLAYHEPERDAEELIEEAVTAAAAADVAVVVVATTESVESEGADRTSLELPGRQDELVSRVAAANPRTIVVVNAGAPVELPWREEVAAVLLSWFPGQEAGAALADVLLGIEEPGGRLPTTWPVCLADAPVTQVIPEDGTLHYSEGVFIGYRAWQRTGTAPAYPFGHGLGYTDWSYERLNVKDRTVSVRLRNTGSRPGREVVQFYVTTADRRIERPVRWLAGFATVEAPAGESVEATIELFDRTFQIWDEAAGQWTTVPGVYAVEASRSITSPQISTTLTITPA
ncbi:glycoside hydrolase family 3 C-terminal domain-containing protein [Streptomyces sp. NEAU-YJ-81]|uniref:glycoside hydrolase family 3 protein n=1 Tax=Streptomyces sp. NEAU-YJ-81 TaxID=2820288 RepID=UPI001ABC82FF|nr:glycoside hydrolase family 3 C-terminal domain-containing protein [Streptomyces sp. NEAU-YJ-81]MBO3682145.1 glycoside hydrolase family 3 protein [Streptomyces sp. NEAU-YJ-81]